VTEPTPDEAAEAVRLAARARGFDWSPEEARAISDQLRSTRESLERARARFDEPADEPTTAFEAGR